VHNKIAIGLYIASGVLPPLVYLVAGARFWDFFWVSPNYALAFSLVAIALAVAQASFAKATLLDVASASLWLVTCLSIAILPLVLTPPFLTRNSHFPLEQVEFARVALLVATAVALSTVAVRVGLGRRGRKCVPGIARQLSVLGVGILALYLVRDSMLICRLFTKTEIGDFFYEGKLRLIVASMVTAMLVVGALIAHIACKKTVREKA
jgi:hypothetical protein